MKNLLLLLLLLPAFPGFSQIFTGGGGPIADDGTHSYFPLTVSGLPATIDAGFGLETVCIDLTHTWNDDLIISLISPDGTEFELATAATAITIPIPASTTGRKTRFTTHGDPFRVSSSPKDLCR